MVKILFDMPGEDFRAELLAQLGTRMCIDAHNSREIAKNDALTILVYLIRYSVSFMKNIPELLADRSCRKSPF